MRSAAVAGVPASGVGPGDLKSNSGVFERAIDGVRWIDPVFYPDSSGVTQVDKRRQGLDSSSTVGNKNLL